MNTAKLFTKSITAMNTRFDLVFWGANAAVFDATFDELENKLEELELIMSRYNERAEVFRINTNYSLNEIQISDTLTEILKTCYHYYQLTGGYFDISHGEKYHAIKNNEASSNLEGTFFTDRVSVDFKNKTLKKMIESAALDLGGIGKGIALNEAAVILEKNGIENALLCFGGSSILTRGRHPHGQYWPVGLENSVAEDFNLRLNNHFVSISKSNRNTQHDNHIVNPVTNQVVNREITTVIKCTDPILAEVLSTALVAAPKECRGEILENFKEVENYIFETS